MSRNILRFLIGSYRVIGGVHLGGACRFEPSCSEYALHAIEHHQPARAVKLITQRVLKCRPGGPWGYDPVPTTAQEKMI